MSTRTVERWICESCGFIYDPEEGDPDGGIDPGTPFEDIPENWFCPVCGARKRRTSSPTKCERVASPSKSERFGDRAGLASVSSEAERERLRAFDREHVWHPYEAIPPRLAPLQVTSALGVRLRLADGRELIDGMSSWWCAIHGYRHPRLDAAIAEQLGRMAHVMFGGLMHEPAIRLAEELLAIVPASLERVFFADSGSVAVEVAIKMALQYQRAAGMAQRSRLMTIKGGYHGDTFGAMAICDPLGGMHSMWGGVLAQHVFAERPPDGFEAELDETWAAQCSGLAARHADELAAIVLEPVVQGAGGMRFHSPACVAHLRRVCDEHGMLLVLDEIATGFGRTGALFACEHAGVLPDVMCLGKALSGGYLTLAATLCSASVAEVIGAGDAGGALMHGPTFMANPLACAVARASLGLLREEGWRERVATIEAGLGIGLEEARALPGVADVRVLGAIAVIELDGPVDVAAATRAATEQGVWLRPFGNLIYAMPPYVIDQDDLGALSDAMLAAARVCTGATVG